MFGSNKRIERALGLAREIREDAAELDARHQSDKATITRLTSENGALREMTDQLIGARAEWKARAETAESERDAWKAVAEALAGEVLDRHGENASSCSPAFAAHRNLMGK